jgi:hypothetical protein
MTWQQPDVVAKCQITLDGMIVLGEQRFTVGPDVKVTLGTWHWSFPLGLGGGQHMVTVAVKFER